MVGDISVQQAVRTRLTRMKISVTLCRPSMRGHSTLSGDGGRCPSRARPPRRRLHLSGGACKAARGGIGGRRDVRRICGGPGIEGVPPSIARARCPRSQAHPATGNRWPHESDAHPGIGSPLRTRQPVDLARCEAHLSDKVLAVGGEADTDRDIALHAILPRSPIG